MNQKRSGIPKLICSGVEMKMLRSGGAADYSSLVILCYRIESGQIMELAEAKIILEIVGQV
jgi:hypothetical protein